MHENYDLLNYIKKHKEEEILSFSNPRSLDTTLDEDINSKSVRRNLQISDSEYTTGQETISQALDPFEDISESPKEFKSARSEPIIDVTDTDKFHSFPQQQEFE